MHHTEKKERKRILDLLVNETRTIIIYEAPHRLKTTLAELFDTLGDRRITACRELTKKHETCMLTTLSECIAYFDKNEPRGEFVLVIEGKTFEELDRNENEKWQKLTVEEHMQFYLDRGLEKKEAMKAVAKDRGVPKQEIYKQLL